MLQYEMMNDPLLCAHWYAMKSRKSDFFIYLLPVYIEIIIVYNCLCSCSIISKSIIQHQISARGDARFKCTKLFLFFWAHRLNQMLPVIFGPKP